MRKLLSVILVVFVLLSVVSVVFLEEVFRNKDLREFYFFGKELNDNYLEKEKVHMDEVKNLVNIVLLFDLLLIFVLLKFNKVDLKLSGKILVFISVILFFGALNFDRFFWNFHLVFFNSDNWLLPADSLLIKTYPFNYFRNMFIFIDIVYLIIGFYLIDRFKIFSRLTKLK